MLKYMWSSAVVLLLACQPNDDDLCALGPCEGEVAHVDGTLSEGGACLVSTEPCALVAEAIGEQGCDGLDAALNTGGVMLIQECQDGLGGTVYLLTFTGFVDGGGDVGIYDGAGNLIAAYPTFALSSTVDSICCSECAARKIWLGELLDLDCSETSSMAPGEFRGTGTP